MPAPARNRNSELCPTREEQQKRTAIQPGPAARASRHCQTTRRCLQELIGPCDCASVRTQGNSTALPMLLCTHSYLQRLTPELSRAAKRHRLGRIVRGRTGGLALVNFATAVRVVLVEVIA